MVPDPKVAPGDRRGGSPESGDPGTLAEVERLLAAADYPQAVLVAFRRVMVDVQRAYGTRFPSHWTGRDVLAHGLRADSGNLRSLLLELYGLYEPVRFGPPSDPEPAVLRELVRRIYAETPIGRPAPPASVRGATPTLWDPGRASRGPAALEEGPSW